MRPTSRPRLSLTLKPAELGELRKLAAATFSRPSDLARRCVLQALADMAEPPSKRPPRPPPPQMAAGANDEHSAEVSTATSALLRGGFRSSSGASARSLYVRPASRGCSGHGLILARNTKPVPRAHAVRLGENGPAHRSRRLPSVSSEAAGSVPQAVPRTAVAHSPLGIRTMLSGRHVQMLARLLELKRRAATKQPEPRSATRSQTLREPNPPDAP